MLADIHYGTIFAIVIAATALVLSVVALRRQESASETQGKTQAEVTELQGKLTAIEEERRAEEREEKTVARMTVRLEVRTYPRGSEFIIKNDGPAHATDVDMYPESTTDKSRALVATLPPVLPVSNLGPGQSVRVRYDLDASPPPPYTVTLRWRDGRPDAQEMTTIVTPDLVGRP